MDEMVLGPSSHPSDLDLHEEPLVYRRNTPVHRRGQRYPKIGTDQYRTLKEVEGQLRLPKEE